MLVKAVGPTNEPREPSPPAAAGALPPLNVAVPAAIFRKVLARVHLGAGGVLPAALLEAPAPKLTLSSLSKV